MTDKEMIQFLQQEIESLYITDKTEKIPLSNEKL